MAARRSAYTRSPASRPSMHRKPLLKVFRRSVRPGAGAAPCSTGRKVSASTRRPARKERSPQHSSSSVESNNSSTGARNSRSPSHNSSLAAPASRNASNNPELRRMHGERGERGAQALRPLPQRRRDRREPHGVGRCREHRARLSGQAVVDDDDLPSNPGWRRRKESIRTRVPGTKHSVAAVARQTGFPDVTSPLPSCRFPAPVRGRDATNECRPPIRANRRAAASRPSCRRCSSNLARTCQGRKRRRWALRGLPVDGDLRERGGALHPAGPESLLASGDRWCGRAPKPAPPARPRRPRRRLALPAEDPGSAATAGSCRRGSPSPPRRRRGWRRRRCRVPSGYGRPAHPAPPARDTAGPGARARPAAASGSHRTSARTRGSGRGR